MKLYRISEVLYLVIAVISLFEAYKLWTIRPEKAYLFLGFTGLALFMYFFRKRYSEKFNNRK